MMNQSVGLLSSQELVKKDSSLNKQKWVFITFLAVCLIASAVLFIWTQIQLNTYYIGNCLMKLKRQKGDYDKFLRHTLGPLFAILAISLLVVLVILLRTLNSNSLTHQLSTQKTFLKCMAVIFTLSYAVRAIYSCTIGFYAPMGAFHWENDFDRTMFWITSYLLWDVPSIMSILLLHYFR
jgi:hypothetical protein